MIQMNVSCFCSLRGHAYAQKDERSWRIIRRPRSDEGFAWLVL